MASDELLTPAELIERQKKRIEKLEAQILGLNAEVASKERRIQELKEVRVYVEDMGEPPTLPLAQRYPDGIPKRFYDGIGVSHYRTRNTIPRVDFMNHPLMSERTRLLMSTVVDEEG